MTKLMVTIEGVQREATEAEAAQILKDWEDGKARKAAELEAITAKNALLQKLGITADEAALLLS